MNTVFEKSDYESVWHPIRNVAAFFRHRKWACQRSRRGFCERDAWSVDSWFFSVVPDLLTEFLRQQESIGDFPDIFLREYYDEHEEEIAATASEMKKALAESRDWSMKTLFLLCPDDWPLPVCETCRQKWRSIVEEICFLLREADKDQCSRQNPDQSGEKEKELIAYRDECRKKGFALLSDWLLHLWT